MRRDTPPLFIIGVHTVFPLQAVVDVVCFSILLWWVPKQVVMLFPIMAAWVFAPFWVEAAFASYIASLMFGVLLTLVDMTGVFSEK